MFNTYVRIQVRKQAELEAELQRTKADLKQAQDALKSAVAEKQGVEKKQQCKVWI